MHSNVLVIVQCIPYKIVLQMHVLFELLSATEFLQVYHLTTVTAPVELGHLESKWITTKG